MSELRDNAAAKVAADLLSTVNKRAVELRQIDLSVASSAEKARLQAAIVTALGDEIALLASRTEQIEMVVERDADIVTVSARDADIATVALRDQDIGTVADRDAAIGTVAGIADDVSTVAGAVPAIGINASREDEIVTVAGIATEVQAVAARDAEIVNVSQNIGAVESVADNMPDVLTVQQKAAEAEAYATAYLGVRQAAGNTMLSASDIGWIVAMTNTSDAVVTVPAQADVAWTGMVVITVLQRGTGQVTLAGDGFGLGAYAGEVTLAGPGAMATLIRMGADDWVPAGNLVDAI